MISAQWNNRFTLIEVLITLIITTVIAALLIGAFHTGIMGYRKTSRFEKSSLALNGALQFLQEDVRRFVPQNSPAVTFTSEKLSFYLVAAQPFSHLELVTYEYVDKKLRRTVADYRSKNLDGPPARTTAMTVLDNLDRWSFVYQNSTSPRDLPLRRKKSAAPTGNTGSAANNVASPPAAAASTGTATAPTAAAPTAAASQAGGNNSPSGKNSPTGDPRPKMFWPALILVIGNFKTGGNSKTLSASLAVPFFAHKLKDADDSQTDGQAPSGTANTSNSPQENPQ